MKVIDSYPWIYDYLMNKKGVQTDYKPEWDWTRFMVGSKCFAAFCGENGDRTLFTLKCDPALNIELRGNYKDIIPGYYCNKEHWNSVIIPSQIPDEVMKMMIDSGYSIVFNSLTKKLKQEILNLQAKGANE